MKTLRSCLKIRNTHFYIIRWGCRFTHFIFLFLCSITFSTCCTTCTTSTTSTDTITLTLTYGSTTTAKTWNLLLRQISCDATWKAPTDCVQYFTGSTGTIQSYNFAGGQLLQG